MRNAWQDRYAIVQDSREQQPLDFDGSGATVVVSGLPTGDYSLEGLEDRIAIERKNPADWIACVGRERERFEREIERLWKIHNHPAGGFAAVVIEASLPEIAAGHEMSMVAPAASAGSMVAWSVEWGFPFVPCGDRRHMTAWVLKALEKFYDYAVKGQRLRRAGVVLEGA